MVSYKQKDVFSSAFTIVELLIVVVVIAILAAITIVSYNALSARAKETALKSDLRNGATQLKTAKATTESYPTNTDSLKKSNGTTFLYTSSAGAFCLSATSSQLSGKSFYITESSTIQEGACSQSGDFIQTITSTNCSSARIMAVDARDNRTYWVQKLADGKCWMLTNLAYAGGGTNTYSDVKSLTNGTGSASTYTTPSYYIPPSGSNPTTNPTAPSTSSDGGATNPQYGYLYNWCAAMGGQATSACANAATPTPDPQVSICPANWRLPTGEATTGDFTLLNDTLKTNASSAAAGLRSGWLAQLGAYWNSGSFSGQGSYGHYWSSTQDSATSGRNLYFDSGTGVIPSTWSGKQGGFAVRCVAL